DSFEVAKAFCFCISALHLSIFSTLSIYQRQGCCCYLFLTPWPPLHKWRGGTKRHGTHTPPLLFKERGFGG
ncbi:MAG: hypothetical protein N2517_06915, partial [Ignavibacteria bacterium]|nr:hypothetical protein [Ignavibacteria bacterium]